jgi:hypothetical protein
MYFCWRKSVFPVDGNGLSIQSSFQLLPQVSQRNASQIIYIIRNEERWVFHLEEQIMNGKLLFHRC